MKFTCAQNDLHNALNATSRVISAHNTLPVLGTILIEAHTDRLTCTATNLEIALVFQIPATVQENGSIAVPAKTFSQCISLLPSQDITCTATPDNTLIVTTQHSRSEIKGMQPDEFPAIPHINPTYTCSIPAPKLDHMVSQVIIAAATTDTHPLLASVLFHIDKNTLTVVATDSYRLTHLTTTLAADSGEYRIIIPARALTELLRLLAKNEDEVTISATSTQVVFKTTHTTLITRLIEGKYPPFEQIIPTSTQTQAVVNTRDLLNTLRRAQLFSNEGSHSVKFSFTATGTLTISADTEQIGKEQTTLPAEVTGEDKIVAFNAQYVIDVLNKISTEDVRIEITTESSPGVFKPTEGTDTLHVIMPLKL